MKTFKLPDLGEGLPDAIIREWYVKVGDEVTTDQPLVAMETAKALVDVPAPFSGTVEKLFGAADDTIQTGDPLIGFEGEAEEETPKDAGTVVGAIEESKIVLKESAAGISTPHVTSTRIKATPSVRALAKRLNVDLTIITPSGPRITTEEVNAAAISHTTHSTPGIASGDKNETTSDDKTLQNLTPVRQAMVLSMTKSHKEVVPITLTEEVDIHAWKGKDNITLRIIRAITTACQAEPMLNALFDSKHLKYRHNEHVNLGLAIDTEHGLYVPVLKNVGTLSDGAVREQINQFKEQAQSRSIAQDDLHGATIILSNYGAIAGRHANMILLPPMTAIVGVGRLRDAVVAHNGAPAIHPVLPLSVTADHRAVTGGELARFLKVMIENLSV